MSARRRGEGFTLLEVLAVVLILSVVFVGMGRIYRDLVAPTATAPDQTRVLRRGLLLVDRIAGDLQGTVLLKKPEETDPIAHPWLFLAEGTRSRDASDRLKFASRSVHPSGSHAGDLAVVAYWVERGPEDGLRLYRWSSALLPEQLEKDFPRSSDPGAELLAEDVQEFAVRFTDAEGEAQAHWDSSTLAQSSQIPVSAEVEVALVDPSAEDGERSFSRTVVLPVRPLDLAKAESGEKGEEDDGEDEEDAGCVTVGQCVARNAAAYSAFLATQADPSAFQAAVDSIADQCWEDAGPALGMDLGGCE